MNVIRTLPRTRPTAFSAQIFPRGMFDALLSDPFFSHGIADETGPGAMALDVSETEKDVIVRASLPGFTSDQVQIEVHEGVLKIHAERSEETEECGEKFSRKERYTGSLSRTITLPAQVADDRASAQLKDGVLTLTLPKHERVMPKKIAIS